MYSLAKYPVLSYIATTLLIRWLAHATAFESMTLMFQREVAERITARPGDSAYSSLSVLTGYYADAEILFDVPAEAFVPAPKIMSTVVQIVPLAQPRYDCSAQALELITRTAFGQRRKMLRQSLKSLVPQAEAFLEELEIPPTARAEERAPEDFRKIAEALLSALD